MVRVPCESARVAALAVPGRRITLICIGEHAGIARFGGLGELTPAHLRAVPERNASARLTPERRGPRIGGVHLRGHDVAWRWDDGTGTISPGDSPGQVR